MPVVSCVCLVISGSVKASEGGMEWHVPVSMKDTGNRNATIYITMTPKDPLSLIYMTNNVTGKKLPEKREGGREIAIT